MTNDELFMKYLYHMTNNIDLCNAIMQIHDVVYNNGDTSLVVDPDYEDAVVADEPMPKINSIFMYQPETCWSDNLGSAVDEMKQSYRENVLDPIHTIIKNRPKSEMERLIEEPAEHNPMYKRW